jgi:peptidoglycan/LPS O-acetylase OafA/YrhL
MIVFSSHVWDQKLIPGEFGVSVFFLLSGFSHHDAAARGVREKWLDQSRPFLAASRVANPAAAVSGSAGCHVDSAGSVSAGDCVRVGNCSAAAVLCELLVHLRWPSPGTRTDVVWSLAVEEHFYWLFPLLYFAMQRSCVSRKHQAWLLWGLCAAVLAWRCVLVLGMHATRDRIYLATDTRLDSILFGCALAGWNSPVFDKPWPAPNLLKYLLLPVALVVLIGCAYSSGAVFRDT